MTDPCSKLPKIKDLNKINHWPKPYPRRKIEIKSIGQTAKWNKLPHNNHLSMEMFWTTWIEQEIQQGLQSEDHCTCIWSCFDRDAGFHKFKQLAFFFLYWREQILKVYKFNSVLWHWCHTGCSDSRLTRLTNRKLLFFNIQNPLKETEVMRVTHCSILL